MEKNSEGRKAGTGASSARRQRTGYKEYSDGDMEELVSPELNARLRERVKDPAGPIQLQGSIKRRVPSGSQIKRKQNNDQNAHIQTRARFSGGIDETSESAEAGASDDDDMPPAAVPQETENSRHKEKERVSVIVPRKARTAIMKRFQDSPQRGVEISAVSISPVTFRAPAPPNRTLTATSKPGKKPKLRSGKVSKAMNFPVISEQEVEAAEALSDLSRMFVNPVHDKEVLDVNSNLQSGFALGISLPRPACSSSPLRAPTSVSSPDLSYSSAGAVTLSVGASQQAGVLKRKRPSAVELNMEACVNTAVSLAASKEEPDHVGLVFCTTQSSLEINSSVAALGGPVTASSPNAQASSSIPNFPLNSKCVLPPQTPQPKVADQVSYTIDSGGVEVDTSATDSMKKDLKVLVHSDKCKSDKLPTTAALLKDVKICKGSLYATPHVENEVSRRSPAIIQEVSPVKLEIDLMASPPEGSNEHLGAAKRNEQEALIQKSSSSSLEKERAVSVLGGETKEDESAAEHIGEVVLEQNEKQTIKDQKGREMIELNRQQPQNSGRKVKADIRWPRNFERSGVSYQLSSGLPTSTLDKGTRDKMSLPVSVNLPGWPGVLPTLGYYGPAAAAAASVATWPGVASLARLPVCESNPIFQLPSCVIPPRQTWKHCALHVYIARFIGIQQQMAGNPFFAATYGDPANIYPLPPTGSIYGTAAAAFVERNVSGPSSSSNMLSAIHAGSYGVGPLSSKEFRGALTNSGAKHQVSTSCTDAVLEIPLQEQPQPSKEHKFLSPLQISTSTGSSVSAAVSLKAPGTTGAPGMLTESSVGTHNSNHTGDSESPLSRAGPSTPNGTPVSMASVQAQYIQAVMQQNTFPFIFPHFGSVSFPNASVHVGQQQPPQFFNTQYFHTQPPPPKASQQTQLLPNTPSGLAPQQKQQVSRTSLQHTLQTSPQQVQCQQAKESSSNLSGTNTLAESKILKRQQNFYGHASSSTQIPSSVNLSPSISSTFVKATPSHQEFNLVSAPGIKRNLKNQQQKQPTPMQRQSQQLSGLSSNMLSMQQMEVNGGTPGFSLGMKGLDAQTSQTFHGISVASLPRGSVGSGPLGLASVAAVMAPEGHAVLPNIIDPRKSHTQYQPSKSHHSEHPKHANHVGQQQEASVVQKFATGGVDDVGPHIGSSTHNSTNHGGNLGEDKKSSFTQALGSSLMRVDFETQLNSSNVNSTNFPFSRTIDNGGLILTASNSIPSHPGGQTSSYSFPMPNIPTNQSSKQIPPRDKILPSQNVVIPSTLTSTSNDHASLAMNFTKGTPAGLFFPSPQVSNSNNQIQAHPSQHSPVKSLQDHIHGSYAGVPESSLASPLAAGKSHMQLSRSSPAIVASPAPRFASPISSPSPASGSMPSSPLPPISKSPCSGSSSPKILGNAKSSLQAAQKASTATGKRTSTAASMVGTTPALQSMPFKSSQLLMQPAQQMQASQLQPTILPSSFQLSSLQQRFQQQQSHPMQQQNQQAQTQSLQQQQQMFFQQQHQQYLHQQHHKLPSQSQGHSKNQQNQTVLHQSQQQHLGAQLPSQSRLQKPHHQSAHSSPLSNLTVSSSPSQSTLTMGSSHNVYAEGLTETFLFNEDRSNCGGSRQNLSDSLGITGAYVQAHSNSDGQCQEQVKSSPSVASSTQCRSPATTGPLSSFDLPTARIMTSVVPNKSVAGQVSGVNSAGSVALKATASLCTSSTVTATARIPSTSNDSMTKKVGSYSDSDLGSIRNVSVSGTSASLHHQCPEDSVQPNNSTHQMTMSTTPCPLPNTSSNAQAK